MMPVVFYDETALAERWNISVRTLRGWRLQKKGPEYVKFGRTVRYSIDTIIEYEKSNTIHYSDN